MPDEFDIEYIEIDAHGKPKKVKKKIFRKDFVIIGGKIRIGGIMKMPTPTDDSNIKVKKIQRKKP